MRALPFGKASLGNFNRFQVIIKDLCSQKIPGRDGHLFEEQWLYASPPWQVSILQPGIRGVMDSIVPAVKWTACRKFPPQASESCIGQGTFVRQKVVAPGYDLVNATVEKSADCISIMGRRPSSCATRPGQCIASSLIGASITRPGKSWPILGGLERAHRNFRFPGVNKHSRVLRPARAPCSSRIASIYLIAQRRLNRF